MEGDASTSKQELDMRWDGRGLDVGRYGQGGAGWEREITGAASVRLLILFADRLLYHREPQALLLSVLKM